MILTWVVAPILTMVTSILGVLPSVHSFLPDPSFFGNLGRTANRWAPWFPWSFLATIVEAGLLFILPAFIAFEIAQWCYRELPDLWGFGPS
jgi:hypothetical protein